MRKETLLSFLILFFVFTFVSSVFASSIKITNPKKNSVLKKSKPYLITWIKVGQMNDFVKIRLFRKRKRGLLVQNEKVMNISNNTQNDGSYSWFVPNSLPEGEYFIRVKTVDNRVYYDSDIFKIESINPNTVKNRNLSHQTSASQISKQPDFTAKILDKLWIDYKQEGNRCKGIITPSVIIKNINYQNSGDVPNIPVELYVTIYRKNQIHINNAKHAQFIPNLKESAGLDFHNVASFYYDEPYELILRVKVDPNNYIEEIRESNNFIEKRFRYAPSFDLGVKI